MAPIGDRFPGIAGRLICIKLCERAVGYYLIRHGDAGALFMTCLPVSGMET